MPLTRERTFAGAPAAAWSARDFVAASLIAGLAPSSWGVTDDAVLVVSELVTAGLEASSEYVTVRVVVHDGHVDIDVGVDAAAGERLRLDGARGNVLDALTTRCTSSSTDGARVTSARLSLAAPRVPVRPASARDAP